MSKLNLRTFLKCIYRRMARLERAVLLLLCIFSVKFVFSTAAHFAAPLQVVDMLGSGRNPVDVWLLLLSCTAVLGTFCLYRRAARAIGAKCTKADAVIFSGGKFINGPQTTGIVLGLHEILDHCRAMASPNVRIGRPYKVGKEEYAAFYRACMDFLDLNEEAKYQELKAVLEHIKASLSEVPGYHSYIEETGRLGQQIPMLYLQFTDGTTGKECYDFLYSAPERIDIGTFNPKDPTGDPCRIFINAINLREPDLTILIHKLNRFLTLPERGRSHE